MIPIQLQGIYDGDCLGIVDQDFDISPWYHFFCCEMFIFQIHCWIKVWSNENEEILLNYEKIKTWYKHLTELYTQKQLQLLWHNWSIWWSILCIPSPHILQNFDRKFDIKDLYNLFHKWNMPHMSHYLMLNNRLKKVRKDKYFWLCCWLSNSLFIFLIKFYIFE